MSDVASLLDTPKKQALESQSIALRASLKEFERTFTSTHGHKPTRDEIKAVKEVAAQYTTYNKIRDVLRGSLTYEEFAAPARTPTKTTSRRRKDSGLNQTPRYQRQYGTPRKELHPSQLDPYDAPSSTSPKPLLLSAIGPTPQRDGRVLGLFDMLSASRIGPQTPSTISRKRRLSTEAEQSLPEIRLQGINETPRQKRNRTEKDILQHLTGTPAMTPETGRRRQTRTPTSEGKKFMLSHFFATPSTTKYASVEEKRSNTSSTPLRNSLLHPTSGMESMQSTGPDATPGYLRRSTSFKDRLMSATSIGGMSIPLKSPISNNHGPRTLRHIRMASKPLSQIVQDLRVIEEGDYEDDLDALREMEASNVNTIMIGSKSADAGNPVHDNGDENQDRIWKKKGQKRTTRRSRIRPAMARIANAPVFVSAEDHGSGSSSEEEEQSEDEYVEEATVRKQSATFTAAPISGSLNEGDTCADEVVPQEQLSEHRSGYVIGAKKIDRKAKPKVAADRKAGKINPNAQAHMNFRSLKIRNKNSKGKMVGGRFGKRRR